MSQQEQAVRVELDIFSGRESPSWTLSPGELSELMIKLRQLPPGGRQVPCSLGYRGFLLHRMDSRGTSRPWLRVVGGVVSVSERGRRRNYRDTEGIEAWLRTRAEREGFGFLLDGQASQ